MENQLDSQFQKICRGPKLEGCTFANFGNSSGTEGEPSQKREKNGGKKKKINAAATGNRTWYPSITDQMSVLTNQVHLKIQFSHRFDQKCPFTDSLHRLSSRFARTSSVPFEINVCTYLVGQGLDVWGRHVMLRRHSVNFCFTDDRINCV